jgi:hypothetical protein
MNKAIVTAIAALFITSFIQTSLAMPEPVVSVEPSHLKASQGDTFTANITVNPDGFEIIGAQYDLYFNITFLNAIEQTQGPFLSQDGASTMEVTNTINNTLGKSEYGEIRMGDPDVVGGITNPGILATVTFNATESGTSSLSLSNVVLSSTVGEEIKNVLVINGTCVTAGAEQALTPSATPTLTATPTSTPTQTPTSTPASGSEDSGNGEAPLTPTETPGLTPTQVPTIYPAPSPTTTASQPSPASEEHTRVSGFETVFVIIGLLVVSGFIINKKGGGTMK